jgi:carboxymethylenebutenolidase
MRKYFYWAINSFLIVLLFWMFFDGHQASIQASSYIDHMTIAHQEDQPITSPIVATAPQQAVTGKTIQYGQIDGQPLTGYISRPEKTSDSLPALIVIHEWWGLNDNIKMMTDRLAGEGYIALAVDLYNGKVADDRTQARELVTNAFNNSEPLKENIKQAYQYLETTEKAPKIGSIGWCFGGFWSLNTALLLPQQLDATVIYYGGNIETNPDQLKALQMPILGIFASLDQNPSVEVVKKFETNLKALNKPVEIHIYEGANHAFANPSGTNYNQEAAEDAWQKTVAFLADILQSQ